MIKTAKQLKDLIRNLETVLAEKLETVIFRTVTNTRMRDFYQKKFSYAADLEWDVVMNAIRGLHGRSKEM